MLGCAWYRLIVRGSGALIPSVGGELRTGPPTWSRLPIDWESTGLPFWVTPEEVSTRWPVPPSFRTASRRSGPSSAAGPPDMPGGFIRSMPTRYGRLSVTLAKRAPRLARSLTRAMRRAGLRDPSVIPRRFEALLTAPADREIPAQRAPTSPLAPRLKQRAKGQTRP